MGFVRAHFVSFMVNALNSDLSLEVSAIAVPAANMATAITIRFISRNKN